jgi:hypothetical protein
MDLLPEHTHHALWDSLTRMHRLIYELNFSEPLVAFCIHDAED